ncbi:YdcF family protein, partial [Mycobacterium tuberculosis]|uniref:YdcF family protein n=1 Tax=Mycobacterium tuberculosis TaxID=1773 RepID=UPI001ADF6FFB
TNGNAREAADWAAENHFGSLVIVTSAYHVPRALTEMRAEFRRRGLTVELQAIGVRKHSLGATAASFDPETLRVLLA